MPTLTPSVLGPRPLFGCLPSQEVLDHVSPEVEPDSLLSPAELARAEAFTLPDQRRDFVAARLLTRLLLLRWRSRGSDLSSIADIVLDQSCAGCGGPHGRPADVLGLGVSWAHAGGFVAAAVGSGAVGVDVEPMVSARLDRPHAAGSLRAWVRAEAIVKWGHGTLDDAVRWQPLLEGRLAPRGQRYVVDDDGRPHRRRPTLPLAPSLFITDAAFHTDAPVCSVAANRPARLVNPLQ